MQESVGMRKGEVAYIKRENGYGFVTDEETLTDYFFAAAEMPGRFGLLDIGDKVVFRIITDIKRENKMKAIQVYKLEEDK